jgi:hypothetical protein
MSNTNFNDYINEYVFFDNLNDDHSMYEPEPMYIKFNSGHHHVNSIINDEIPLRLYIGNDKEIEDNEKSQICDNYSEKDCSEINSVLGETEFHPKANQQKKRIYTNSTDEADSSSMSSTRKSYEKLFTMIDDKNKYQIGQGDDKLSPKNSVELIELDKIIYDHDTNLNFFIEDMLKNCPCDNLIKKQRIYKAKNIKRKRKTKTQIRLLEKEFKKNSSWDKDEIKRLSVMLDLNRDQVYKWYWDQKKKTE